MTRHCLTLVHVSEILDLDPDAVLTALPAFGAVDVRLRGFSGADGFTNCGRLSDKHWERWGPVLERVWSGDEGERPTYAGAVYALARHLDLECWGHGWLEASSVQQAREEAVFAAMVIDEHGLTRWGVNGEIGLFGRPKKKGDALTTVPAARVQLGIGLALEHLDELMDGPMVVIDWMGFASLRWMYGGDVAEFSLDFVRRWALAQMVYQTAWEGRAGAKATSDRGREIWEHQVERGGWSPLIGVGRWEDRDHDGLVDPGEVVGSVATLRHLIATYAPAWVRHYVGNGAASQLTVGRPDYPALAELVPSLEAAA